MPDALTSVSSAIRFSLRTARINCPPEKSLQRISSVSLSYQRPHHEAAQISFYGGTFLGIGKEKILEYLGVATRFVSQGQAESIRFSTRPDTITPGMLDLIEHFPVRTIELGVQSMDDAVLQAFPAGAHSP